MLAAPDHCVSFCSVFCLSYSAWKFSASLVVLHLTRVCTVSPCGMLGSSNFVLCWLASMSANMKCPALQLFLLLAAHGKRQSLPCFTWHPCIAIPSSESSSWCCFAAHLARETSNYSYLSSGVLIGSSWSLAFVQVCHFKASSSTTPIVSLVYLGSIPRPSPAVIPRWLISTLPPQSL